MITENLSTLKIHKLTKAQYDRELEAGRIDPNALYLTPDKEQDFSNYATKEYVEASVANLVNSAPEALDTLGELAIALDVHEGAYGALLETVGSKATYTDLQNLKEELSESITSEATEWKVVDGNGNIIFSVDANGAHMTSITINGKTIQEMIREYVDEAILGGAW